MTTITPIRTTEQPEKVTNSTALRALAFVIVAVPILVPVNVILWRIAVGPWS